MRTLPSSSLACDWFFDRVLGLVDPPALRALLGVAARTRCFHGGGGEPAFHARFAPAQLVAVLMISGTDDPLVPYHGGSVARGRRDR